MRSLFYKISIVLLISQVSLFASVPDIVNFTTKDYKSHSINYDFAQDSSGMMYIANAYCVLEYDGSTFRKIPLVDGKSALSLAKDKNGRIYVGSSSEFGYLTKDSTQQTIYKSLRDKIPGNTEFDQIFRAYNHQGDVYFVTIYNIYKCVGDSITKVEGTSTEHFLQNLCESHGELLYWQDKEGLGSIKNGKASIFFPYSESISVYAIEKINNNYVLFGNFGIRAVHNDKLFEKTNKAMGNAKVSSVLQTSDDEYLIGTFTKGIFVMNANGEILRHFTTQQGLQDNFIHRLFKDSAGNIWIAYDNGVGILKWKSPIRYITNSQGFAGMGYTGIIHDNQFFIGTSQGLYYMDDWENKLNQIEKFKMVQQIPITGVTYLANSNGQLIICQTFDAFTYNNGKYNALSPKDSLGALIWSEASLHNKNEAFIGRYEGISRYEFSKNGWKFQSHIKGFKEYSRVLEIDQNGVIWVVQGNKGLYRVELNEQRDSALSAINYSEVMNVSPDYFNDIFIRNDTIHITSFGGVYKLLGDSLQLDHSFDHVKKYVERARKFDDKGIYGIYKDQAHILEKKKGMWEIKNSPVSFLRSNLVGSAEFFRKISPGKYLIGVQDGFAMYEPAKEQDPTQISCLIRGLEILNENNDSLIYNGKPLQKLKFPYEHNNLRFWFTIPVHGEMAQVVYETQLLRNDIPLTNWQVVQEVNFREYTNLKEGNYEFIVRAKKGDTVLGVQSYRYKVMPPWYRTTMANAFYFILIILFGLYIKKKFKIQAMNLKAEKERELEIKEKLHNAEKLEVELKNKENELAYMALSYTQKKEMLASVISKLDSLSKELEHSERNKVNSLKRSISTNIDDESNWDNFQVHFDQKNNNFFQKLKEVDPRISESYLLFCSYVRMGKSNKEIADLLNISVAAVEKRKYRLKKKWELEDDTSFTEYLKSL